ncbi:ABC transporter ATP-binding protein [Cohnella sp.]|uniref:ABC transporter ATP-binding protein n=1 Tax=Cohnella sp. TaxID=1883426 RepID=UPI003703C89F
MPEILRVEGLFKSYRSGKDQVAAIDGVSFSMEMRESIGLVGESGSGKSTLVRLLLALERPDAGEVWFDGQSLLRASPGDLRRLRKHIQVVFQDATAALNDRLPIWRSVVEPLDNYAKAGAFYATRRISHRRELAERLLVRVGLSSEHMDRYPHELSGGQRQRVGIARGIGLNPKLLVCDEPTSSLDVTAQAQIIELLQRLQRESDMSILFISHDIALVAKLCDRLLVMQEGRIVDDFAKGHLWDSKRHPYTQLLLAGAAED